jgi:hypothetical protein
LKKSFKAAGITACLLAVFVMVGGHWLLLQSFAWGTMLVKFSQRDSFLSAVVKTFDGRHPCSLCLKVRDGVQQETQKETKLPWSKSETLSECVWEFRTVGLPAGPCESPAQHQIIPHLHSDFTDSPPTPPPRG